MMAIACLGLILAGCTAPGRLPGGPPGGIVPPTATATLTPPPPPTLTPLPPPTDTPTVAPTLPPTDTPLPTPTLLFLPLTPLPLAAPPITLENAGGVSGLAEWYEPEVMAMAWTPEANTIAIATSKVIHFYNVPNRTVIRSLYPTLEGAIDLAFDPAGTWLVLGTRRGSEEQGYVSGLELWQGPNWRPLGVLYADERPLTDLAFSPDHSYMAAGYTGPHGSQSEVDLWSVPYWSILDTLDTGQALNLGFSLDGGVLALSPDRYALHVYDLIELKWLYRMPTSFNGAINCLAFSPDGFTLATGHYDGLVRLWDLREGTLLLEWDTGAVVQSITFSPDGRVVATGSSYENTLVRLWSAGSGVILRELAGHTKGVTHLEFSPDSQFLVSASYDGMVRVWGRPVTP